MSSVTAILERTLSGQRLEAREALLLLESGAPLEVGDAAHVARLRHNPEQRVGFIIERNINYTNVCITYCSFCAFYRAPGDQEGYVLSPEIIHQKVAETVQQGGTGILLQGGHHPDLPLSFYEEMLAGIKERHPIHIHGFSPSEIQHIARVSKLPLATVLQRLKAAGLDSVPGGGAEILVDQVREDIAPLKTTSDEWLDIMEEAHGLGLSTSVTMMMGCGESPADRVEHLQRVRELQDRTGGFLAFIVWTFQPGNNPLGQRMKGNEATAQEFLLTLSTARLFLDNVAHFQSSWLTQGLKLGQVALRFGADDMGSVMIEENVVSSAGSFHCTNATEMRRVIQEAGFEAFQRDNLYRPLPQQAVSVA